MCEKIKEYVKDILDLTCTCEYVDCTEDDCSSFYRVTIPNKYRIFKKALAMQLLGHFDDCEITVQCK